MMLQLIGHGSDEMGSKWFSVPRQQCHRTSPLSCHRAVDQGSLFACKALTGPFACHCLRATSQASGARFGLGPPCCIRWQFLKVLDLGILSNLKDRMEKLWRLQCQSAKDQGTSLKSVLLC